MKTNWFCSLKNEEFSSLIFKNEGGDGLFCVGREGVQSIYALKDNKVEFINYSDKTLAYIKSSMGYPAIYPMHATVFEPPAKAVLMDLDGTSIKSEKFWIWIIQKTTAILLDNPKFELEDEDEPFVSGNSVSEHLKYCINKYCPEKTVEEARQIYYQICDYELNEIMEGRGRVNAFEPMPGLKEFLLELKARDIKIGLVTSGLYKKAWPEIAAAFRTMNLGCPADFYDAIITAGFALIKGQAGTLGELEPKPHPWLFAETARVGLGIDISDRNKVIGLEDSSAGIVSIRLAGFCALGVEGGNIKENGAQSLCRNMHEGLVTVLQDII